MGLDACTENIEAAREHLSLDPELQERLSYQCCTVEEVHTCWKLQCGHICELQHAENLDGPCYDAVVASEVIEHVDNPEIFLTYGSLLWMSFLTLKALFQEMLTIAETWWLNIFDNNQQVIPIHKLCNTTMKTIWKSLSTSFAERSTSY